jgi:hypothetical protein
MRTDQTALCPSCGSRFARGPAACPACGGAGVVDLRDEPRRETALQALLGNQRAAAERRVSALEHARWGGANIGGKALRIVGVTMVLLYLHPAFFVGVPLALVYLVVGLALRDGGQRAARNRLRALDAPRGVHVLPAAAPPAPHRRAEVRGRVRVVVPVTAPLSGARCAAFRLAGVDDHDNRIDDGGVGELELVTAEGEVVRLSGDAAIDLRVGAPAPVAEPSPALRAFVADRGVAPGARLALAEALLRDGDEVIARGEVDRVAVPAGYRDSTWVRALTGPVLIRRESSVSR